MIKKMICIECPKSCALTVEFENCQVMNVQGGKCPKGAEYAKSEIENPQRILTGTVLAEGLSLKMIPVRTDKPIPKARILEAAAELKKIRVNKPVQVGDVIVADFMGLGVDLVSQNVSV